MKKTFSPIALIILLAGLLGAAGPVWADWTPGDPYKWLQMPDLNENGVDVQARSCDIPMILMLADDFRCEASGPITDIHIWGSVLNNQIPTGALAITLAIWSDIPAENGGYSHPGTQVWTKTFDFGEYDFRVYPDAENLLEFFWNPATNEYVQQYAYLGQVNFYITPDEAFKQEEGTTYWLSVQVGDDENCPSVPVGWKASDSDSQWGDDAVWMDGAGNWNELRYWQNGESMDLAFAITTVPLPGGVLLLGSGLLGLLGIGGWRRRRKS